MPSDEAQQVVNVIDDGKGNVKLDIPENYDETKPLTVMHNGIVIGQTGFHNKPIQVEITAPKAGDKITDTGTAAAVVYDIFAKPMPEEPVVWTTSNANVLTIVEDTGAYTPVSSGDVTITASVKTDTTRKASVKVTVEKQGG